MNTSSSTAPFDLIKLPNEVSSQLMITLANACERSSLLALMRLNKDFYAYFSPWLYRNITLTNSKNGKSIFDGLNFQSERKYHYDKWDKERIRMNQLYKNKNKNPDETGFWSWFKKKPVLDKDNLERKKYGSLTQVIPIVKELNALHIPDHNISTEKDEDGIKDNKIDINNLASNDPLIVHKRKMNLLGNTKWITVLSLDGLIEFSKILQEAYKVDMYQTRDPVDIKSKKQLFENIHGICFNSNIKFEEYPSSNTFTIREYLKPIKKHLKPNQICILISPQYEKNPLYPKTYPLQLNMSINDNTTLGKYLKDIYESWFLDLVIYHISLPRTTSSSSSTSLDGGNNNLDPTNLINSLISINNLPQSKKIIFKFDNCCTKDHNPKSDHISPRTTAEKYSIETNTTRRSWELIDLHCWNMIGTLISKIDQLNWIQNSTWSIPINNEEDGKELDKSELDKFKFVDSQIRSKMIKYKRIKPILEIHNLPCLKGLTLDSLRLAASKKLVDSSRQHDHDQHHNQGQNPNVSVLDSGEDNVNRNWMEERNEWLESNLKIIESEGIEEEQCMCPNSMYDIDKFGTA
ncbi:uncharacterized protein L201_001515 [Kwoniella dendrophila CBS 6074]|uniref:F-box domain-containing protein n=1 Tax=Kwoniella dendrophila CBS 6074 TaxID=1295534 RepID=A0AAX4JQ96_9TREE